MGEFVTGAFLLAVGLTGNAGGLLEELAGCGSFVVFATALGVFYFAWDETPDPERKPVRLLIVGLAMGVILTQWSRLSAALSAAWTALTSLTGGSIANANQGTSGAAGSTGGLFAGNVLNPASGALTSFGGTSGLMTGNVLNPTGQALGGTSGLMTGNVLNPTGQALGGTIGTAGASTSYYNVYDANGNWIGETTDPTYVPAGETTSPVASSSGTYGSNAATASTQGFGALSPQQIVAESSGQQFNSSGAPLISSAGAVGEGQILPGTAADVAAAAGIPFSESELENDATYNLTLSSDYMTQLLTQFGGNRAAALAAYNAGPNNAGVQEYALTGNSSYLPSATQSYLNTVLGAGNW